MKHFNLMGLALMILATAGNILAQDIDSQAKALFDKAVAEFKEGNLEASISHATSAWRKDRGIMSLSDSGMIDGFDKYLRDEILQSPDDPTDYYRLAKLQAIRGMPREAESLLKKVVELSPDSKLARKAQTLINGLGQSLAEQDYLDEDKAQYDKVSRQDAIIESIEERNRELAEENARLKKEEAAAKKADLKNQLAEKDARIKKLQEENKKDKMYSTLFWANPTNAYLMEKNYNRNRIGEDLKGRLPSTLPSNSK